MKAKREYRVPLCGRAPEILDVARAIGRGNRLVFPMRSGKAISASTLLKMLQYHRIAAAPHGFRSSFRDWAAEETDHPREVIEAALAAPTARLRPVEPVRASAAADGRRISTASGGRQPRIKLSLRWQASRVQLSGPRSQRVEDSERPDSS